MAMGPTDLEKLQRPEQSRELHLQGRQPVSMNFVRTPADFENVDGEPVDDSDFGYVKEVVEEKKETNDEMIQLKLRAQNEKR